MKKKQDTYNKIVIGASGSGTTFEAIVKAVQRAEIKAQVVFVFVDRDCKAIERAKKMGIQILSRTKDESIENFHRRVVEKAITEGVKIICLCGYLRLFPISAADPYIVLNSHPGKIPEFGGHGMYGLKVHEAVLKSGAKKTYSTIHIASAEYDRGPVLGLIPLEINREDTPEVLAKRLLPIEHNNYIAVLKKIVNN